MTNTIADITGESDAIMLVGSNPEHAHPVIGMQVRQAVERGAKLIVVDPRDIDIASKADVHLKLKPGTNVAFANGMMNVFIEEDLIDKKFIEERTENFEAMKEMVKDYTPERVAEICGIDPDKLREAARIYATADKAPIMYCLGVTEHHTGTEGVMSLSNVAMMVGKIGRPGCGVNPIRGQNNVQGACDMGASPTQFPGYQNISKEGIVEKFEEAWGVELNRNDGIKATDCFPKMISGEIKGLFIFGEDPVRTDPNTNHVIHALESLDFFVVDDMFMTETAKLADVVLPGISYTEKEGTFSNTERRVQRIRKAVESPGQARPDTWIFTEIMNRMGYPQPHLTPAEIMDEIASVTPSFGGISHARLDSKEVGGRGLQWPCPTADHPGTPIMHVGKFARGLGLFRPAAYTPSMELPDEEYPLTMMTGRILYHYNACAMTDKTEGINIIAGESFIEINTEDANALGIADREMVAVSSRRGKIQTRAIVSDKTRPGEVWMPFHYVEGGANWLTNDALDSISSTPEYKVCAVKVEKL
jgi:formate dehydrogenase major subunit